MNRYCYFADYEIMAGHRYRTWGQTTLVYQPADPEDFDPAEIIAQLRQQVADTHGVHRSDVRIRNLSKL